MTTIHPICPSCGGSATESIEVQHFEYGPEGHGIKLCASVPVITCKAECGQYTDWRGEAIREAVIQHNTVPQLMPEPGARAPAWDFNNAVDELESMYATGALTNADAGCQLAILHFANAEPDANCITTPDGGCVSTEPCMHSVRKEMTFIEACLRGEARTEEIDNWVERWHGTEIGSTQSLRELLGMTRTEYALWMREGDKALAAILVARRSADQPTRQL
jgi:hypothetical protein